MKATVAIARFVLAALVAGVGQSQDSTPTDATDLADLIVGCGIYVQGGLADRRPLFFAKPDESVVIMRIDGDHVLLASIADEAKGRLRDLGDTMSRVYQAEGIRVEAKFAVSRECPPTARECDGVGITANFVVRRNDTVEMFGEEGGSGC